MPEGAIVPLVERLLLSLFSSANELGNFVERLPGGQKLTQTLPDRHHATLADYSLRLITGLVQQGRLDSGYFFQPLMDVFRGRGRDIRVVAQQVERVHVGGWLADDMRSDFARPQLDWLQKIVSMVQHEIHEHCVNAPAGARVRDVFADRWPTLEDLGYWSVDKVRKLDFVPDCAALLNYALSSFELGIEGKGDALLRDIFPARYAGPTQSTVPGEPVNPRRAERTKEAEPVKPAGPTANTDRALDRDLGSISVKEARQRGLAPAIAFVVRRPVGWVAEQLDQAHGRSYVSNLFWDYWPDDDSFGDYTIAQVQQFHLTGTIAALTGISFKEVQQQVAMLHKHVEVDRIRIRTVFSTAWPPRTEGVNNQDTRSGNGMSGLDLEELTAGASRRSPANSDIVAALVFLTGARRSAIEDTLFASPESARLRDILDGWPDWNAWMRLTGSNVRRYGLVTTIARRLEMDPSQVEARIEAEHGSTQISKILEVAQPSRGAQESLGDLTLAEVDRRGLRDDLVDFLSGRGIIQRKGVSQRFNSNSGNTLVRNVFKAVPRNEWPIV